MLVFDVSTTQNTCDMHMIMDIIMIWANPRQGTAEQVARPADQVSARMVAKTNKMYDQADFDHARTCYFISAYGGCTGIMSKLRKYSSVSY